MSNVYGASWGEIKKDRIKTCLCKEWQRMVGSKSCWNSQRSSAGLKKLSEISVTCRRDEWRWTQGFSGGLSWHSGQIMDCGWDDFAWILHLAFSTCCTCLIFPLSTLFPSCLCMVTASFPTRQGGKYSSWSSFHNWWLLSHMLLPRDHLGTSSDSGHGCFVS